MSGPKAFRIVTRAEIVAICRRDLARLDAAVESWISIGKRSGTIGQPEIDKVVARRAELRRLLDTDSFLELQKNVAVEIGFLHADRDRRIDRAAEAATRSRRDARRSKIAAGALLQRLQGLKVTVPPDILGALGDSTSSSGELESAMARALSLLAVQRTPGEATDRQRQLAAQLGAGESRLTLQDWISAQVPEASDPALTRVDDLLGELDGLGIDPSPFSSRLAALEAAAPNRRPLIADSLLLDLTRAVKEARAAAQLVSELCERRAELSTMASSGTNSLLTEIDVALASGSVIDRRRLLAQANSLIEEELKTMAATERRRAVLEGLASLGYEVSEGMATAWVKDGQIVLSKPANPGYGVELSGGASADLLQVRAVGIGGSNENRDINRDRDMETIWCSEFERLKTLVAKAGGDVSIVSARPVGQFPLKVVAGHLADQAIDIVTRHRSLP